MIVSSRKFIRYWVPIVGWMLAMIHPASAQPAGTVDVSATISGFSSPTGVYGPWSAQELVVRLPPTGALGVDLTNRNTRDVYAAAHTEYASLDYYRPLSRKTSLYALIGSGSGAPFARQREYIEMSTVAAPHLSVSAGAGSTATYGLGIMRSLAFGATYYAGDGYASLRYVPAWCAALGSTRSYLGSIAFGHPGATTETLYLGTGNEGDVSLVNPSNPTILGERETNAAAIVKHWFTRSSGVHLGLEVGTLDRIGSKNIYVRRSITLGAFTALR